MSIAAISCQSLRQIHFLKPFPQGAFGSELLTLKSIIFCVQEAEELVRSLKQQLLNLEKEAASVSNAQVLCRISEC